MAKLDKVRKGQGDRCQEACDLTPTFLGRDLGRKHGSEGKITQHLKGLQDTSKVHLGQAPREHS